MEEKELIEEHKAVLKESVEFFSSANKVKRELWVVKEFLSNLGIKFIEDELVLVSDQPPDVKFHNARFEIKEILDEGRKRHREYKEKLAEAQSVSRFSDLLEMYTPKDISAQEIVGKVSSALDNIVYANDVCKDLDLLFYVNLSKCSLSDNLQYNLLDRQKFERWRSVSFVKNGVSCVLLANERAPKFLKLIEGKIKIRRNERMSA